MRRDPEIGFGGGWREVREPAPWIGLPSAVPRSETAQDAETSAISNRLNVLRRRLSVSTDTFDALAMQFAVSKGPLLGSSCVREAFGELFDFSPISGSDRAPVIIAGANAASRRRAVVALARKLNRAGRDTLVLSLDVSGRRSQLPVRRHAEVSLPVRIVHGADDCRRMIAGGADGALVLIESSGLDNEGVPTPEGLAVLREAIQGEIVYMFDGFDPVAESDVEGLGIRRFIVNTRIDKASFGAILDLAYLRAWAFAGVAARSGIFYELDAFGLTERYLNAFGDPTAH